MIQEHITKLLCYYRNKIQSFGHCSKAIISVFATGKYNRNKCRSPLFRSINSLVAVCFFCATMLQTGCSKMNIPDYPRKIMKQYQYALINEDGLSIAIRPLLDSEESLKYFKKDLLSKNILAVYVEVENRNVSSSYILLKDKISLANTTPVSNSAEVVDRIASVSSGRKTMEAAVAFYYLGIIIVPLMLVGAGMLHSGAKTISNASEKRHNFTVKELQTQTLSPGEGTKGFVYFKLADKSLLSGEVNVNFEVIDLNKRKTRNMVLPFDWEKK